MELEGRLWRDGRYWLVEVPSLDIMTQGKTKADALFMIKDAILEAMHFYFGAESLRKFTLAVNDYRQGGVIGVTSTDNKLLLALSLRRQRQKSGSTIRQASERLGSRSPNAYAQYERGRVKISMDRYEKLLQAANPNQHSLLRVV